MTDTEIRLDSDIAHQWGTKVVAVIWSILAHSSQNAGNLMAKVLEVVCFRQLISDLVKSQIGIL